MPIVAGIAGIAGPLIGGIFAKKGADKQAQAALDAQHEANQIQQQQYEQNRADLAPWRNAGGGAVSTLASLTMPGGALFKNFGAKDFQTDPGYQFRMDQGAQALQRSAAAKGGLFSGGTLKDLTDYNQNFASNEYQNAYNRFNQNRSTQFNQLASLAGLGQTAASNTAQLGANSANQIANNTISGLTGAAAARASGYNGLFNGINQGLTNGLDWYQMSRGS